VLNNFNLTQGTTRYNSPIAFSSTTATLKKITSSLTSTINSKVLVNLGSNPCSRLFTIKYTSETGAFTDSWDTFSCNASIVTLDVVGIETAASSNELALAFKAQIDRDLTSTRDSLAKGVAGFFGNTKAWFALLAIVVIILIIGIIIVTMKVFGGENRTTLSSSDQGLL